jgi:hypothetical protein
LFLIVIFLDLPVVPAAVFGNLFIAGAFSVTGTAVPTNVSVGLTPL